MRMSVTTTSGRSVATARSRRQIADRRHHLDVGVLPEQLAEALADEEVVLRQRHADRHGTSVPGGAATRPRRAGMTPVQVLTVDDQPVFREAARALIASTPGFVLAGEAASGTEAFSAADHLRPDLMLLDVGCPASTASRRRAS